MPLVAAYPEGLEIVLAARWRHRDGSRPPWYASGDTAQPRIGVKFADGRRAYAERSVWGSSSPLLVTAVTTPPAIDRPSEAIDSASEAPVLVRGEALVGRTWAEQRLWLWPLPPPGSLTLVWVWPEHGLPEESAEIDVGPLREAAGEAVELWPDERPPYPAHSW